MNFEWLTLIWLMENLNWIILFLSISIVILFLFPVLLGYDLYDDFNQIINKLNRQELIKTNNYLKTQNKILRYHKKNNNIDSIRVVEESIKLVESFRAKLNNEF